MKETLKRTLATILVVAIVLCSAPLSGLVGIELPDWLDISIESSAVETATSGSCGENLTWVFDDSTGTLTISGTGSMKDFDFEGEEEDTPPWTLLYYEKIKKVVIEDGVTTIGDYAFAYCSNLANVEIPNSVTTIGDYAFAYCSCLTGVTIPEGVTTIGDYAFAICEFLVSVEIPNSVTTIGDYAFYECYYLTNVEIPNSVTTIGVGAFDYCYLFGGITVDKDNQYYSSDEYGVLFNKDKTELIKIPEFLGLLSYEIPDGVTTIKTGCCYYCEITQEIIIPTSVLTIEENAIDSLNAIYYKGTEEQWSAISVDESNDDLFGEKLHFNYVPEEPVTSGVCGENLTWEFDETTKTLTISGTGDMNDYWDIDEIPWISHQKDIVNVVVSDGITSIGGFAYLLNLKNISIPNSVTTIGDFAFEYCYNLANVEIPNSVTTIGGAAFGLCTSLESVTIPKGVTSIGDYAFYYCTSLESITIPESVTTIGEYAFVYCYNLANVEIPNSVTTISEGAFGLCIGLESITIPKGVTTIGAQAFAYCYNLANVEIPNSVTTISEGAFANCFNLSNVYYDGTADQWMSITFGFDNEFLLSADIYDVNSEKITSLAGTCGENLTWEFDKSTKTLTISGTGDMDDYANYNNYCPWKIIGSLIENVVIEDGVTSIGDDAFYKIYNLVNITIPVTVTEVGSYAFGYNSNLEKVYFGGTADQWNAITIASDNSKLYSVDIFDADGNLILPGGTCGENLTWEFDKSTKTLTISGTGDMYDYDNYNNYYPWKNIESLIENVVIEDGVTSIGDDAFYNIYNLVNITIPVTVTEIGRYAFGYNSNLEKVYFGGTADQWNAITIASDNSKLYSVDIFDADGNLILPGGTCGENLTWEFDKSTKTLTISGTGDMYDYANYNNNYCPWKNIESLIENFVIEDGVTSIGDYAFFDFDNLVNITIPVTVTEVGSYAFYYNSNLEKVHFLGTQEQWNEITIGDGNPSLTNATIHYGESIEFSHYDELHPHYAVYTCSECNDTFVDTTKTKFEEIIDEAVSPNCTETGLTIGSHCSVCGEIIVEQKVVDALGHSYGGWMISQGSTCTKTGIASRMCSVCGDLENKIIPVIDHTIVIDDAVAPTCTETGLTEGKHCSACDEVIVAQEEIPTLGHNYGEWVIESSSTCTKDGKKTQTCLACGDMQTEIIAATGHVLGNPVVENSTTATCGQVGSYDEVVYCTVCNEEVSRENKTVDSLPHSYDNGTVTTEPTCTALGVKTYTCSGCGNTYTEVIEAIGHTPETVTGTAPTCTQTGLTDGSKCSVCGEMLTEQETINALGHKDEDSDGKCDDCEATTCDCKCHKTGITKFFWSIGNFFRKIFGKDKICVCGKAH